MMKLPEVIAATGLSRSSLYDAVKDGTFPEPRRINKRSVAWRSDEIDGWMAALPRTSEQPTPDSLIASHIS